MGLSKRSHNGELQSKCNCWTLCLPNSGYKKPQNRPPFKDSMHSSENTIARLPCDLYTHASIGCDGDILHVLFNVIILHSSVNCTKQIWMEVFRFRIIVSDSPDLHSKKLACLFVFVDMKMRKFMFIFWCLLSGCCCSKYCLRLKSTRWQVPKKIICFLHRWESAQYNVKSSASGIWFCPDFLFQFFKVVMP